MLDFDRRCCGVLSFLVFQLSVSASADSPASGTSCRDTAARLKAWTTKLGEEADNPWPLEDAAASSLAEISQAQAGGGWDWPPLAIRLTRDELALPDGTRAPVRARAQHAVVVLEQYLERTAKPSSPMTDSLTANESSASRPAKPSSSPSWTSAGRRGPASRPAPAAGHVLLAIDREVPWATVVEICDAAARRGFPRQSFLFASRDRLTAPPASAIERELRQIEKLTDPDQRASRLRALSQRVLGACPRLATAVGAIKTLSPGFLIRETAAWLPTALESCQCRLDVAAFQQLFWTLYHVPFAAVTVTLMPGPGRTARVFAAPRASSFAEVAQRLARAAQVAAPLRLLVSRR